MVSCGRGRAGETDDKLADNCRNYIMVVREKELSFVEGDIVEAEGLFDSNFISSESRFNPTLSAQKIRVIKAE